MLTTRQPNLGRGTTATVAAPCPQTYSHGAPVVNAGPNQIVERLAIVQLAGTVTFASAPCNALRTTLWSQYSGTAVTLSNPSFLNPTFTASTIGNVVFTLEAHDDDRGSADRFTVTVIGILNVNAGPNQSITYGQTATLAGSASGDGAISHAWTQTSGPGTAVFSNAGLYNPTITFPAAGTYALKLTASSPTNQKSASMVVTVAPVLAVNAGFDAFTYYGSPYTLQGTATGSGTITQTWSKTSGPGTVTFSNATALSPSATFSSVGTYTLTLTATNGTQSASASVTIGVFYSSQDGGTPLTTPVQAPDGFLYGLTATGGSTGTGTVYRASLAGTVQVLHDFNNSTDGGAPNAYQLVMAGDGALYGSTERGVGTNYYVGGTLFKVRPYGAFSTLHQFTSNADGQRTNGLTLGADGNLYGTVFDGGANGGGYVFRLAADGTKTTVYDFPGTTSATDGNGPNSNLVLTPSDDFYGTTAYGGVAGYGIVYRVTTGGVKTVVAATNSNFSSAQAGSYNYTNQTCILGADGNLYAWSAGLPGYISRITSSGVVSTLHSFNGTDGSQPNGLVAASDGAMYGVTVRGGANNLGTVFKLTTAGVLTTLHSFTGMDGSMPYASPMQASDGNLYGAASAGGSAGNGVLYRITTGGTFTLLHSFGGV